VSDAADFGNWLLGGNPPAKMAGQGLSAAGGLVDAVPGHMGDPCVTRLNSLRYMF